jgi:RNA polymerase sigma-70 factor (sigma-E family)
MSVLNPGEAATAAASPVAPSLVDRGGFDEFVVAASSALLRTAYLLTQDPHLAEDLVQTTLAKAWFARRRIVGDPAPYVRRILVNEFASGWRRKWRGEHPTADLPETHSPSTEPHPDLWHAVANLPRRQRAVIVLRFFDDLTEAETARALGVSVGTVKSQTAKALAKLRVDPLLEVS